MSYKLHRKESPAHVCCAVITVSDKRTHKTDVSGKYIKKALESAGHKVRYAMINNEKRLLRNLIRIFINAKDIDAVITTGGTGISSRDITVEVARKFFEKELVGFGELFRAISYKKIGSAALLSRATAGVVRGKIIICIPGAVDAVKTAMQNLILPELPHLVYEAHR